MGKGWTMVEYIGNMEKKKKMKPTNPNAHTHDSNAIHKKHAAQDVESLAPATQNDLGDVHSAAPATKNATHLLKTWPKYCACNTK